MLVDAAAARNRSQSCSYANTLGSISHYTNISHFLHTSFSHDLATCLLYARQQLSPGLGYSFSLYHVLTDLCIFLALLADNRECVCRIQ